MAEYETQKRDAQATRSAILAAGQRAFTAKGFDAAGVRDIAKDAGVNVALINRYFGSKEGLFAEAVLPEINVDHLLDGDRATFGQRVAAYVCRKSHEGDDLDGTQAFLRSIGSPAVNASLTKAIEHRLVERVAQWIGGKHAKHRAALIVAHLAGFDLMNRITGLEALGSENADLVAPYLAATIQRYVDDNV